MKYLITAILLIFHYASSLAAPVLSNIETKNLDYPAGSGKIFITKSISLRADSRYIRSASIRIFSGYNRTQDILSFKNTSLIKGSWDAGTGVLTLSGLASVSSYQSALRSVMYENINKINPSSDLRNITFTVTDNWGAVSNTVSRNITVIIPNSAPRLFNMETDPVIFCINTDSSQLSQGITISDSNDQELYSAVIRIVTGYNQQEDLLIFAGSDNITGSWNPLNGSLSLSGKATIEQYNLALRGIYYKNLNSENPLALYHQVNFSVSDGIASSNEVSRNIVEIIPSATISGSDSICSGETSSISVSLTGSAPWNFSYALWGGPPIEMTNVNESPVSITVDHAGSYVLSAVSDKFCPGKISGLANIELLPSPQVSITGLDPAYSQQSSEWIPLHATPEGGQFSGSGVLPYGDSWFFIPSLPSVGLHNLIYKYRESDNTCYGYDTVTVRILENSSAIEFEGNRTHFCHNEQPVTITGINLINDETGTFSITGGNGLTDNGNNTATLFPMELQVNHYTVTYTAFDGTTVSSEIEIGSDLIADFKWETECYQPGEEIRFSNKSVSTFGWLNDDSFNWTIYSETDTVRSGAKDLVHTFGNPGFYTIQLTAENSYGCRDVNEKLFSLNSVIPLAESNYYENFEGLPAWHSDNDATMPSNSWKLGSSSGFVQDDDGEKYWYTDIVQVPSPREHSWITSPCFDFRGTERPTLVTRIQRYFTNNHDGANIEYSTDDGLTWSPVGYISDGLNWYNGYLGIPGEQSEGWAYITDNAWTESRHVLDFLSGEPKVQFRINYYAFGNAIGNKGVAIDDFEIVKRNRTILIEHFTNAGCEPCREADSILNLVVSQAGGNVIDIQYHTANSYDPLNLDNPVIPATRQFYYGLTGVPFAIVNGGSLSSRRLDFISGIPQQKQLNVEALYDSDFDVEVISMLQGDTLYAEMIITSLKEIPLSEIAVRMAVIEPLVDEITGENGSSTFRNVIKAMLPDAAGNVLYKSWNAGESLSVRNSWPVKNVYDYDALRVVGFLQDENTREISQAALDTRGIVSDSELEPVKNRDFTVFPVPAHNIIYIKSGESQLGNLTLKLYNGLGNEVLNIKLNHSVGTHELDVRFLTPGIYYIVLEHNNLPVMSTPVVIY